MTWGFLGLFSGFWKLVLVASLALIFYGRSGMLRDGRLGALLRPGPSTPRERRPRGPLLGDRGYLILVVTAATAVAAWIVTRMTMMGPASPGP